MNSAYLATYIWVDADGNPRSKVKILQNQVNSPDEFSIWNFDG